METFNNNTIDILSGASPLTNYDSSSVKTPNSQLLQEAFQLVKTNLQAFAQQPNYLTDLEAVYGKDFNRESAQSLFQDFINNDFSKLPSLESVPSEVLNGAEGAYAAQTNTIYLSDNLIYSGNPNQIADTWLHEIGHSNDPLLNPSGIDTPGEEGEKFKDVVLGKNLSSGELIPLNAEEDSSLITINGKSIHVELASPSDFGINLGSTFYSRNGNKFVSSNGTGGTYLWCTDFAFGRALEKGLITNWSGLGGKISSNAGQWDDQAGSFGKQAKANSFMVLDPNQAGAGSVGHVAYVERVNPDGSFVISEANWGSAVMSFNSRTIPPGSNTFNSAKFVYLDTSLPPTPPSSSAFRGVSDYDVNIRSDPGTNNSVVGSLTPGVNRNFDSVARGTTHWDSREQRNDNRWFRIQGTNNWISAAFITGNPLFSGTADTTLNVRSGPGTNNPIVGSLSIGAKQIFDATTVGTTHWDSREGKNESRWFRLQGTDKWSSASNITGDPTY